MYMKELIKPKKKRIVFEKVNATALWTESDGTYHRTDSYSRGDGADHYLRGGDTNIDDDILF